MLILAVVFVSIRQIFALRGPLSLVNLSFSDDWETSIHKCAQSGECGKCNIMEYRADDRLACVRSCDTEFGNGRGDYSGSVTPYSLFGRYVFCIAALAPPRFEDNTFFGLDAFAGMGAGASYLILSGLAARARIAAETNAMRPMVKFATFEHHEWMADIAYSHLMHLSDHSSVHLFLQDAAKWTEPDFTRSSSVSGASSFVDPGVAEQTVLIDSKAGVVGFVCKGGLLASTKDSYIDVKNAANERSGISFKSSAAAEMVANVDFVFFDPPQESSGHEWRNYTDGVAEWGLIEMHSRPRFVAVMNTGLPYHHGWIVNRLLSKGWRELVAGVIPHPEAVNNFYGIGGVRDWSILACPSSV